MQWDWLDSNSETTVTTWLLDFRKPVQDDYVPFDLPY